MTPQTIRALLVMASVTVMGLLLGWGLHVYNESLREDGREQIRAAWHKAVVEADQAERVKEQERRKAQEEAQHANDEAVARAAADAAAARDAGERLRRQLAVYLATGRAAGVDRPAAGVGAPAGAAADPLLAELYRRADDRAGALAAALDAAYSAGVQCERVYDALTVP